jgi:hypothetical protein
MRTLLLLTLLKFSAVSCTYEIEEKPGPNGSWWLGGAHGGVFVAIRDDENLDDGLYVGTIYYEHDQSVWYSGGFVLREYVGRFAPSDHSLYEFWDGEKLHLYGPGFLEPTGPIVPQ